MPKNYCIMQIWAESGKSALPICNYSQILYQFLTFTQNLKRSHLSIAFSSVDMGVLSDIRSLFKSIALSINTGTGNVSFELTAKSFSMSIQFSKDLEIKDGVSIEAGVEYKLTYEMPDIKDEITQALSEITETILTFYEEHKTVARVIMVVSILFLAGLATYSFLSTSAGIALLTAIKAGLLQLLPIWISQFQSA